METVAVTGGESSQANIDAAWWMAVARRAARGYAGNGLDFIPQWRLGSSAGVPGGPGSSGNLSGVGRKP
jgi:hypothetical protein